MIPLWKELEYYKDYQKKLRAYLGEKQADERITESLHIISAGTNDFLENYYAFPGPGSRSSQYTITEYQNFLIGTAENFVKNLYTLGARKISLGGLPPMGCMPLERTTNFLGEHLCVERYNTLAMGFNDKLKDLTIKLNKELPGATLVFANPYYAFTHIIRNPDLYGKLNVISCHDFLIAFPHQFNQPVNVFNCCCSFFNYLFKIIIDFHIGWVGIGTLMCSRRTLHIFKTITQRPSISTCQTH